jgi:hypothetical protein
MMGTKKGGRWVLPPSNVPTGPASSGRLVCAHAQRCSVDKAKGQGIAPEFHNLPLAPSPMLKQRPAYHPVIHRARLSSQKSKENGKDGPGQQNRSRRTEKCGAAAAGGETKRSGVLPRNSTPFGSGGSQQEAIGSLSQRESQSKQNAPPKGAASIRRVMDKPDVPRRGRMAWCCGRRSWPCCSTASTWPTSNARSGTSDRRPP